ncbi:MAG: hypothetical protein QM594_04485 [Niabella sp.]
MKKVCPFWQLLFFSAVFMLSLFSGCRRSDIFVTTPPDADEVKAWLRENGGAYSNETLSISPDDAKALTGTLLWSAARSYKWNGADYIDIPYAFSGQQKVGSNASSFNLVVRRTPEGGFEGAIRATATDAAARDVVSGESVVSTVASYSLLNGTPANIWVREVRAGENKTGYSRAMSISLTEEQVVQMRSNKRVTEARGVGGAACNILISRHWVQFHCPDVPYDEVCITGYYQSTYLNVCNGTQSTLTDMDSPGGGGGGGTYPPPENENPEPDPATDPCAKAAVAAAKSTLLAQNTPLKDSINKLGDLKNLKVEKGFALYERVKVDSNDPTIVATEYYYTGEMQTGNDTSVVIPTSTNDHNGLVATVHTHPEGGYSAPSPVDIYTVIEGMSNNTGNFTKNSYLGSFVFAADGSAYALTIANPVAAGAFLSTKSSNLSGRAWNEESEIDRAFLEAKRFFEKQYKGLDKNERKMRVYEEALAVVLDKFKTGVTLMKKEKEEQSFKPVLRKETRLFDNRGKPTKSFVNPC